MIWTPKGKRIVKPSMAECMAVGLDAGLGALGVGGRGHAPAAFVPTAISGLAGWWRGDLLVTESSLAVSAWGDSSGSGDANRVLVQATGGKKPTLTASNAAANNQATIDFVSASSQQLDSTGNWSAALSQPYSIFMVGKDGGGGFQGWASNTASSVAINYGNGSANMVLYAGSFLASDQGASASPKMVGAVFNDTSSKIYENARTPRNTGAGGATALAQLTLGANPGAGIYLNGWLAEVVVYSKALSAGDIDSLCTYFAARYALTIGA